MRRPASKTTAEYIILASLLILSLGLILPNLGNIYLWGDEAHTALLAKTVIAHGVPLVYDGKNYFSVQAGKDYGKGYIWKWNPWFQYYALAPFFAVFGTSTFVARLPFALFGIATIILTYYFAASFWRNRRAGVLSAIVLLICVPFLLLTRQCRYYSADAFFSLLALYGYYGILEQRKRSGLIFVLSAVLLFHTQFVQCAALLSTVITHAILFRRKALKSLLILSGIVAVVSIPWLIWFASLGHEVSAYGSLATRVTQFSKTMVVQTFKHIFPFWILALPIVFLLIRGPQKRMQAKRQKNRFRHEDLPDEGYVKQNLALLLLFAFFTIAGICLLLPSTFFRYLVPLIPCACIIMGLIIESGVKINPAIGVLIIGVLAWWWQMPDYLYEITHDFNGPTEGIVQYLNQHGSDSDIVVSNHDDMPLKFYTKMRIVSLTTGEDFTPATHANWVIIRKTVLDTEKKGQAYLEAHTWGNQYKEIVLPYEDTIFENREDPELHLFRTPKVVNPVYIYHKVGE